MIWRPVLWDEALALNRPGFASRPVRRREEHEEPVRRYDNGEDR